MINRFLLILSLTLIAIISLLTIKLKTQSEKLADTNSIVKAVTDSASFYKDKAGRLVIEKQAIVSSMKTVSAMNAVLTSNQKALVHDIKALPKKQQKRLTEATSIKQEISIDNVIAIDTISKANGYTHDWSLSTDTLSYQISSNQDTLKIHTLTIPNRLLITHYKDRKGNIYVNARNTNPLVKNEDIDTIIPNQNKKSFIGKILNFIAGTILGKASN